jgi:hypothetical protein
MHTIPKGKLNSPSPSTLSRSSPLSLVGGDTLVRIISFLNNSLPNPFLLQWASGYEAYDRLSPAFQKFLEGLTAEHDGNFFHDVARQLGLGIQEHRGSPLNVGTDLRSEQYVPFSFL